MSYNLRPSLFEFADALNDAQWERGDGVSFLSKPYTYSLGDLPGCPTCGLPTKTVRVGSPKDVVSFSAPPVPIVCQPCGHRVQLRVDEVGLLLEHERWRQQRWLRDRERPIRSTCAVLHTDPAGNVIPCPGYPHVDGFHLVPDGTAEIGYGEPNEGHPEPPSEEDLNDVIPVRPDPRQLAYDAVYEYIRRLGGYLPPDPVHRNAVIWRAVNAALGATPVGRCVSSHCVEGDHILPVESEES